MKNLYRIVCSSELKHHGIEGQKWGVRNGPPYPLDRETHTKVVREGYKRDRQLLYKGKLSKKKVSGTPHMSNKWERQWQEVIKASNLPGGVMNVAEAMDSGFADDFKIHSKEQDRHYVSLNDIKFANYGGPSEAGQSNNCVKCSMALEMRRRGYDVLAGRSFFGQKSTSPEYWFDGVVPYKEKGVDNFSDRVAKVLGNNGTAALDFRYPSGGGHSMYAFFDPKHGFTIADGQNGKYFYNENASSRQEQISSVLSYLKDSYGYDMDNSFSTVMRLDTATPNLKHMAEDSVLRMSYKNESMNQMRNKETGKYGTGLYYYKENGVRNAGFDYVSDTPFEKGTYSGPTHYKHRGG